MLNIDSMLRRIIRAAYAHGHSRIHTMSLHEATKLLKPSRLPSCYRPQSIPLDFPCPLHLYEPFHGQAQGTCLFFRGSAFIAGHIEDQHPACLEIADTLRMRVVSIDYPVLPSASFTEGIPQVIATIRALLQQSWLEGPITLWGESCGATILLIVFAACVELFRKRPHHLVLFYPVVDNLNTYPSQSLYGEGFLLDNSFREWVYRHYLTNVPDNHPWISPLFLPELQHIQSCQIIAAACDPTRDEAHALFECLHGFGCNVSIETHLGLIHGFLMYQRYSHRARQAFLDTLQVHKLFVK